MRAGDERRAEADGPHGHRAQGRYQDERTPYHDGRRDGDRPERDYGHAYRDHGADEFVSYESGRDRDLSRRSQSPPQGRALTSSGYRDSYDRYGDDRYGGRHDKSYDEAPFDRRHERDCAYRDQDAPYGRYHEEPYEARDTDSYRPHSRPHEYEYRDANSGPSSSRHDSVTPLPPRAVAPQLRLVKLLSDVLPPEQRVAIIDSGFQSASGGSEEGVSIGRDRVFTRRIRLPSMDVSKHHATIYRTAGLPYSIGGEGGWWIVDQGSAHGTYILPSEKRNDREGNSGDVSVSNPPLSAYRRLSEPKTASQPFELRHGDLVRVGATVFEVHTHSAPDRHARESGASSCCEGCQLDFDGKNNISLLDASGTASSAAASTSAKADPSAPVSASLDANETYASGATRPLAGDRKLEAEAEWKRQMKDLRGVYLKSGASKRDKGSDSGAPSSDTTAAASWKKHLSSKKKRSAADNDGFMVSISTADLHKTVGQANPPLASSSGATSVEQGTSSVQTSQGQAEVAPGPKYVDRAAQRRQHASSIEKTLPRVVAHELAGGGAMDPHHAMRLAAAVMPLARPDHPPQPPGIMEEPARERASASTPLAETNRGFKLLSAMTGGGGGGGGGGGYGDRSAGPAEGTRDEMQAPILARGTSGRAGLGSGALRDVDQIAAASRPISSSASTTRWGAHPAPGPSQAEYGREATKRRWEQIQ